MFPQLGVPIPPSTDDEHQAAARHFIKAVSRREIHSVNGPERAGFRSTNNDPPMKPLGAGEEYRPPNPFLPNERWHETSEGADHAHRVMLRKIRGHKYSPDELETAFRYHLQSTDAAALKKDAFRWETLIDLKDIIKDQVTRNAHRLLRAAFFKIFYITITHEHRSLALHLPRLRTCLSRAETTVCTKCFSGPSRGSS